MEKLLRQFAPFVALLAAAILVVVANPAGNSGGDSDDSTEVAGVSASRATTTTVVEGAADIPTDTSLAPSDVEPFAPTGSSSSSSSGSSFSSTPSFSSDTSSSSSTSDFSTATTAAPASFTPETTPPFGSDSPTTTAPGTAGSDFYLFEALASSAVCSAGGNAAKPLALAGLYQQAVHSSEPSFPDLAGGMASNKADPDSERYLYRSHSLPTNAAVSITDTVLNTTRILSQRTHWERLDGAVWTPNRTLLVGENIREAAQKDAAFATQVPTATAQAKAGHVYEINPTTGVPTLRHAMGSKAHKGMSFDHLGNLYSVSASNPGYVYRFLPKRATPTAAADYSDGELSALQVTPNGESSWIVLHSTTTPNAAALVDSDEAARVAGATQFLNPEDAEVMIITASSGAKRSQLFVAEQGANRVISVILRTTGNPAVAAPTAYTSVYVAPGVNAPATFKAPSDIAIDVPYNLYIAERNGGDSASSKTEGDDIWVAPANPASASQALPVGRLASLTDCDAEPAGLMFDLTTSRMFLNVKHRGGDGRDLTVLVTKTGGQ